jgi:transcriptional regulator with XRE-family HTH domain
MFPQESEDILTKRLGQELKAFRRDRRLTQERFAEHIGCSTRQLQDIENGQTNTSALFLLAALSSMKNEQMLNFLIKVIPEVRAVLGTKVLRRDDTVEGRENGTEPLPPASFFARMWSKI